MPDTEIELIDKNSLITELRSCNPNKKEIIILDCRSANDCKNLNFFIRTYINNLHLCCKFFFKKFSKFFERNFHF